MAGEAREMKRWRLLLVSGTLALLWAAGGCEAEPTQPDPGAADASAVSDAGPETTGEGADIAPKTDAADSTDAGAADTADAPPSRPVSISKAGGLDFEVEEVVYARGLSHTGEFNADASREMDLVGDLYLPEPTGDRRPALLIVHGGGFVIGTRTQAELVEFAEYFASRGWVVFSIDYRLVKHHGTIPKAWSETAEELANSALRQRVGKAIYPAVRDAKAAARWLRANASKYDISRAHIAVMGGSAGAYIGLAMGTTEPADFRDELGVEEDPTLKTTHRAHGGDVAAVLDFWGGTKAMEGLHAAFEVPSRWGADDAPILIVHGTDDSVVSFDEAKKIRDKYRQTGAPYQFVEIEGARHGPWGAEVDGQNLRELGHGFLLEQMQIDDRGPPE